MKDGTSGEKKAKKAKKDKTEHHHHHHHHDEGKKHRRHHRDKVTVPSGENTINTKPLGPAPVPTISLTDRIVQEMHADPLPSPTSPKRVSKGKAMPIIGETAKVTAKVTLPTENLGVIATLLKWVRENMFQPTFSRQKQISDAYSNQFSQTLTAIQKRFSANDARVESHSAGKSQALRFSGTTEEKATVSVVDLSVTATKPKPTLR